MHRTIVRALTVAAVTFAYTTNLFFGAVVTVALLAYLRNKGDISLPNIAAYLFQLVIRGKEVNIG